MRGLALVLAACSGGTVATKPDVPEPDRGSAVAKKSDEPQRAAVDPIAILTPVDDQPRSWLAPGPTQLELGGSSIESPGGNRPIEVVLADRQGSVVRAVVRLPHARFSLWSDRERLFGVLKRDHRIAMPGANPTSDVFVMLHAGARVQRLARNKSKQTQVRYVGALQVEGWIPDDAVGESAAPGKRFGRIPTPRTRIVMMLPGSIVRSEPKWGNNELALTTAGSFIDQIGNEAADGWMEVRYRDSDVSVHGYTSKRQPPGRVHRLQDPDVPPPVITANSKVASGTCLYSKRNGDRIGYIVGEQDVQLDDLGGGWWTLAVDTPWGPIPFAAKGPTKEGLAACAPAGALPTSP